MVVEFSRLLCRKLPQVIIAKRKRVGVEGDLEEIDDLVSPYFYEEEENINMGMGIEDTDNDQMEDDGMEPLDNENYVDISTTLEDLCDKVNKF